MLSKLSQNISIHIQMYKVKIPHSKIKKTNRKISNYGHVKIWKKYDELKNMTV